MGKAGWNTSICTLVRIIQEKVSPTVGTKCMGTKSLSSLDSVFSSIKWAQGKPRAAELLTNADNVRFRRMRWGDLTKGGPKGVLPILAGFPWPLPRPSPPSASPLALRWLRGLRPGGQEATPKAHLAVLVGEHVAAHKAGSAPIPRDWSLV